MKYLAMLLTLFLIAGCGTGFYLNREPVRQQVTLTQAGKSLELLAKSVITDESIRIRITSDLYVDGEAEIKMDGSEYRIDYSGLPLGEEKAGYLKGDLYAGFYAGDYPFKSSLKMFGRAEMKNGAKQVRAKDGYLLYKVIYNGKEIRINNLIHDYTIVILSEKELK